MSFCLLVLLYLGIKIGKNGGGNRIIFNWFPNPACSANRRAVINYSILKLVVSFPEKLVFPATKMGQKVIKFVVLFSVIHHWLSYIYFMLNTSLNTDIASN